MEFNLIAGLIGGFVGTIAMTLLMKMIVMGTLVFGTTCAALFTAFGTASWLTGLLIGLVHAVVAGAIGFPMMGSTHPRMESAAAFTGDATYESQPGSLRIASPGSFGVNYGSGTPMGLLMGHAVYGLVVALIYTAIV